MKVAVIGAGTMGRGIAQTFAQCEDVETVYLCDIEMEYAEYGLKQIVSVFSKKIAKKKMTQQEAGKILGKIKTGKDEIARDPDLVVEAVIEDMEMKKKLFKHMQNEIVENPNCIYATNTSSLSITEIGVGLKKPVIGMHFFNPAPVMKLVEVIAGLNTPKETVEEVKTIAQKLDKTPVQVEESAGFVVNRLLIPMINEAIEVYSEGVADITGIDEGMKLGCNHPMGPLELGDYIGLDVVLAIMNVLYSETADSKYRPSLLLKKMVRGNHLGVKTKIGFYDYADGGKRPIDVEKEAVSAADTKKQA
ncbi:MAG: 3-hydroxyacyl-CoA dehydrogenase NAD-binding domain-containing protein [Solobacterium sp.]|jgi:3-hydroxybutyryl-CoA dehydrogenase|nr:3-hydroxyacyl-CoA dehydrogenase NAD-binding domain-containing protein [Solobacterium sp.]MCH4206063.1 3-hydroxyacyl-CoA dehydrogenase NAD-binding domain-containing protein [Solobacterium sp.]MCH4227493.1 3-hydroxyacyl-CoA dehydrogenase NAD-binding domain-containing protein [Solobacterium sp.]MCH4282917.1 3-hydroxyacyl-CoA dehydrogenase NAD-binding domain-containing protein [Solobacterium sp.]